MTSRGTRSLDIVLAQTRAERDAQLAHFEGLDSKAGVILGFAGALIALTPRANNPWLDVGRAFAAIAAAVSLGAFWPRAYFLIDVRHLRDQYLGADPAFATLKIVDAQIAASASTHAVLRLKARLLKVAMTSLSAVALAVAIGLA